MAGLSVTGPSRGECDCRLRLHAGVVAWRGRAIVMPGDSGAGKSTLAATLAIRGADRGAWLLADDVTIFSADRRRLEGDGVEGLEVGAVVFSRWANGARFRPASLASGHAALALLRHVMTPDLGNVLGDLGRVTRSALCLASLRGEASFAAETLLTRLEGAW